jgi:L-threonylcarbamoyladenylate synthase
MADIGKDIALAGKLLLTGKLVAVPTETVYGLAANALNEQAVLKIFETKNIEAFDIYNEISKNLEQNPILEY